MGMRLQRGRRLIDGVGGVTARVACLAVMVAAPAYGAEPTVDSGSSTASGTGVMPYWQAPALPSAVIQGGAIPAGWQPQAVPYRGVGPDGKPMTMYVAPTYVFTYQSGPPVLATPPVNRSVPSAASGWNYQSQGVPSAPVALPPATVARYQPAPYQFPPDARALSGTPIVPPATPLPAPPPVPVQQQPYGFAPAPVPYNVAPAQPIAAPPAQWVPSGETMPPDMAAPHGAG